MREWKEKREARRGGRRKNEMRGWKEKREARRGGRRENGMREWKEKREARREGRRENGMRAREKESSYIGKHHIRFAICLSFKWCSYVCFRSGGNSQVVLE